MGKTGIHLLDEEQPATIDYDPKQAAQERVELKDKIQSEILRKMLEMQDPLMQLKRVIEQKQKQRQRGPSTVEEDVMPIDLEEPGRNLEEIWRQKEEQAPPIKPYGPGPEQVFPPPSYDPWKDPAYLEKIRQRFIDLYGPQKGQQQFEFLQKNNVLKSPQSSAPQMYDVYQQLLKKG